MTIFLKIKHKIVKLVCCDKQQWNLFFFFFTLILNIEILFLQHWCLNRIFICICLRNLLCKATVWYNIYFTTLFFYFHSHTWQNSVFYTDLEQFKKFQLEEKRDYRMCFFTLYFSTTIDRKKMLFSETVKTKHKLSKTNSIKSINEEI